MTQKPDEPALNIVIVDYVSEKNRGDAAIHLGLINVLHRCYPNGSISAVSIIGANQFHEMELEYDQSNTMGIKVFGGLVPTFYPTPNKKKEPALAFEVKNLIGLIFRFWLLIGLKSKVPVHLLKRLLPGKYQMTFELIKNADLIVIRGRNYRERKTASLEIVRMLSKIFHLLLCNLLSKKMILLGASVWDQKSNLAGKMLGFAFKSCKFVTVRETSSFDAANRLANANNFPEPILIPDLSFAAFEDRKNIIRNRGGFSRGKHPEIIGLTLLDWKSVGQKSRKKYLKSISGLLQYYSDLGSKILIIPQVSVTWENSSKMLEVLFANERNGNFNVISGYLSVQELLLLYASLDLLVATRMHSAIFAAAVNTPIVAIAYDKGGKWSIIEELGYGDYLIDYDEISPEVLITKTVSCWKNKSDLVLHAQAIVEKNISDISVLEKMIKDCMK